MSSQDKWAPSPSRCNTFLTPAKSIWVMPFYPSAPTVLLFLLRSQPQQLQFVLPRCGRKGVRPYGAVPFRTGGFPQIWTFPRRCHQDSLPQRVRGGEEGQGSHGSGPDQIQKEGEGENYPLSYGLCQLLERAILDDRLKRQESLYSWKRGKCGGSMQKNPWWLLLPAETGRVLRFWFSNAQGRQDRRSQEICEAGHQEWGRVQDKARRRYRHIPSLRFRQLGRKEI